MTYHSYYPDGAIGLLRGMTFTGILPYSTTPKAYLRHSTRPRPKTASARKRKTRMFRRIKVKPWHISMFADPFPCLAGTVTGRVSQSQPTVWELMRKAVKNEDVVIVRRDPITGKERN